MLQCGAITFRIQRPMCVSIVSSFAGSHRGRRFKSINFKPYRRNNETYNQWHSDAKKDRKIYEFLITARRYRPPSSNNENSTIGNCSRRLFVATMRTVVSEKHIRLCADYFSREHYKHHFFFFNHSILATILFFR